MEPIEAEAMRWLAGALRWERTMAGLRDGATVDAVADAPAAVPEPVLEREPLPFPLPAMLAIVMNDPGHRVA